MATERTGAGSVWEAPYEGRARGAVGGIVAGLIGGLVLSVFFLVMNLINGEDIWVGAKFAAFPFLGAERVMQPGFEAGPVILGVLCHFAVSAAWGLVFGVIFYGLRRGLTMLTSFVWGLVVWLGMYYAVLPIIGAGYVAQGVPVGMAIFEHVLFGVVVGLSFLPFQQEHRHSGRPPKFRHTPTPHAP